MELPPSGSSTALGAYGVRLRGVRLADRLLSPASPDWPTLDVVLRTATDAVAGAAVEHHIDDDSAHFMFTTGGDVVVDRAAGRATFTFPATQRPRPGDMVHPLLCTPVATFQSWAGRPAFHAGAFAVHGNAWAVMGAKGAGKSTLLASLAHLGAQVLTDDLVVVDDDEVLAGPSCIDLRTDSAAALDVGEDLGVVGTRRRWRYVLDTPPRQVPLRGWIVPTWDRSTTVTHLPPAQRVARLLANVALRRRPPAAGVLLELAARPVLEFSRPRGWRTMWTTAEILLDQLG